MDIKQRMKQVLESPDLSFVGAALVAELCRDALKEFERLERLEPLRIEEHFARLQEVLKAINGNMELMVGVLKQVTDAKLPPR